jgi:hypothetical protein
MEKGNEIFCIPMTNEDLLQKADYNDVGRFIGTIINIFDVDERIVIKLIESNYLHRPKMGNDIINFIQWITSPNKNEESDVVTAILSYLFSVFDPINDEEYQHSDLDRRLINTHLCKIITKYEDTKNIPLYFVEQYYESRKLDGYFEVVSERLWKDPKYLHRTHAYYRERAVRKIDKLLRLK